MNDERINRLIEDDIIMGSLDFYRWIVGFYGVLCMFIWFNGFNEDRIILNILWVWMD